MDTNKTTDPLNRGMVAGLLGMPADMLNMLRNAGRSVQNLTLMAQNKPTIPMQQDPAYGQEWWGNKMQQMGYVTPNRNPVAEFGAGLLDPTGIADTLAAKAPMLTQGLFNLGDPALATVTKGLLAKKAYDVAPDVAMAAAKNLSTPATLNTPRFMGQRGAVGGTKTSNIGNVKNAGKAMIEISPEYLSKIEDLEKSSGMGVLFHRSPERVINKILPSFKNGREDFGGLFGVRSDLIGTTDQYGKYVHKITFPLDTRFANEDDIFRALVSGGHDKLISEYADRAGWDLEPDDFAPLRELIANGASRYIGEDDLAKVLGADPDAASWAAQAIRAKVARNEGFGGLIEEDGHLVFPGKNVFINPLSNK